VHSSSENKFAVMDACRVKVSVAAVTFIDVVDIPT
jgi:hypothetical protein